MYRIALSVLMTCVPLQALAGVEILPWKSMTKIGEATLRFAVWDIYQARLYCHDDTFAFTQPYVLEITYLRNFSKRQLLKETDKQLKKLELNRHTDFQSWMSRLGDIWPDVRKNDTLALHVDAHLHARFYFNHRYIGTVEDPEFSRSFSSIWLAENATRPTIRMKLLGNG